MAPDYAVLTLYDGVMREDLLCEVRGRIINRQGEPLPNRTVEFLPTRPYFIKDGVTLCPIGAKQVTDDKGRFAVLLTRSDMTGIAYLTRGALGNYRVVLNGPGPHIASDLLKAGSKVIPAQRDS